MKKINLNSNKKLVARLNMQDDMSKSIAFTHSFRNNMNIPLITEAEQKFAEEGYSTLAFDFLGHGDSNGRLREVSYHNLGDNLSSAIKYLRNAGCQKVAVLGISLGTIASVFADERPDAQVFINPSPLYNSNFLLNRYFPGIEEHMEELNKNGFLTAISGSGRGSFELGKQWVLEMQQGSEVTYKRHEQNNTPTFIVQGNNDELSSHETRNPYIQRFGGKFYFIEGADHNFSNRKNRKEALDVSLKWLKENL